MEFIVIIIYEVSLSNEIVWGGLVTANIYHENDFASAFSGGPKQSGLIKGYLQTADNAAYIGKQVSFIFSLNLGVREEGVMGIRNKWNE